MNIVFHLDNRAKTDRVMGNFYIFLYMQKFDNSKARHLNLIR